jgi:hypothetical protein
MADAFLEVTEWEGNTPNHIYLLEGDRAIAYIKKGEAEPFYFSKPWNMDKRGRKFVKLDVSPFDAVETDPELVAVTGSKGETYYVNTIDKTCSCPGFKFRGKCKHVDSV